jgi:hypothetical protein
MMVGLRLLHADAANTRLSRLVACANRLVTGSFLNQPDALWYFSTLQTQRRGNHLAPRRAIGFGDGLEAIPQVKASVPNRREHHSTGGAVAIGRRPQNGGPAATIAFSR